MQNEVVTVFGGSGFVGCSVVKRLAQKGAMIRVPSRDPDRAGSLRPLGDVGQIVPLAMGDRGEATIARLIVGADHVINLVGILHERRQGDFQRIHTDFAGRIASQAKAAGVKRLVQMSALGADEASQSVYAQTKARGEQAVLEAFPEAAIIRPSIIFGPGDDFFNRFGAMASRFPFLPLIDGGHTRFQPVYVGDVATAIVRALEDEAAQGQTFELGGPMIYTFRELLEYLLSVLHRRRLLINLPSNVAAVQARFMEYLPQPPLTRDQLKQLSYDNVVGEGAKTLSDLGIEPTPLEVIVPRYVATWARRRLHLPAA